MLWTLLTKLLLVNLAHGLVALVWVAGLRRVAGPMSPALLRRLLGWTVAAPVVVAALQASPLVGPAAGRRAVRVGDWVGLLTEAGPLPAIALGALVAGTVGIFAVQELWPLLRRRGLLEGVPCDRDPRLDASLGRVRQAYETAYERLRLPRLRGRAPTAMRLDSPRLIAALSGHARPSILVSAGLLDRLDDEQLDAVIAHELGHLRAGGSVGSSLLWLLRALQAGNPAVLILFRLHVEAHERECDRLAARVTGKPGALASALLATGPEAAGVADSVARRAAQASVRARVERLLADDPGERGNTVVGNAMVACLAVLMWTIAP